MAGLALRRQRPHFQENVFSKNIAASCPLSLAAVTKWFGRWRPDTSLQAKPQRGIDVKPIFRNEGNRNSRNGNAGTAGFAIGAN